MPVSLWINAMQCNLLAEQTGAVHTGAEHTGTARRAVARMRDEAVRTTTDEVAVELPVALVFNGISHAVMMATPLDLEAFALGFALTEGIVARASDVFDVE